MKLRICLFKKNALGRTPRTLESFPATSNALVVRHLVIYQTASDVVLGFIRWARGHPPDDDPDPIAGVTGWALSLHETKLLRVTDICVITQLPPFVSHSPYCSTYETRNQ
jgi:hypothetical protein